MPEEKNPKLTPVSAMEFLLDWKAQDEDEAESFADHTFAENLRTMAVAENLPVDVENVIRLFEIAVYG
jgi:hypothetical protein